MAGIRLSTSIVKSVPCRAPALTNLRKYRLDDVPQFRPLAMLGNGDTALTPADFAAAYDVTGLQSAGLTGAGHSIAVIARSEFLDSDIAAFSSRFLAKPLTPVRDDALRRLVELHHILGRNLIGERPPNILEGNGGGEQTPQPRGQYQSTPQGTAEVLASTLGERLICSLHDTLRPNIDPRAGRHLSIHRQPQRL